MNKSITIILLLLFNVASALATTKADDSLGNKTKNKNNSFYEKEDRYRGFYFFEQPKYTPPKNKQSEAKSRLTPQEARRRIEARKEALDGARDMMIELGFRGESKELHEAIREYKSLESEMFRGGLLLAQGWEEVNFTNPEFVDRINNPINALGNKEQRKQAQKQIEREVKQFASSYDLVLFEQEGCPYCKVFRPILDSFVQRYDFKYQSFANNPQNARLIKRLGIEAAPTVVAIRKDGKQAFELIRGVATIDELEENSQMAMALLNKNLIGGINK